MNRRPAVLLGLLLTLPLFSAAGQETQRYLVASRNAAGAPQLRGITTSSAAIGRHVRNFRSIDAYAVDLTAAEAADLARSGDVIVEPVISREIQEEDSVAGTPAATADDVTPQSVPWGVHSIHAEAVWPVTHGEGVNVAVLDTGIDFDHPDLRDAYAGGYNTFEPSKPPLDGHRHGTHVAGTIAAADNEFGVIGVAPKVKIWAVKVLEDDGGGTNESIVAGFEWLIAKKQEIGGPWTANLSLGSNLPSEIEERAVLNAISEGIVVVASAGNRAIDQVKYPAKYNGVIAVGAVDEQGKRAVFSSFGVGLSVMAPGVAVPSSIIKGIVVSADVKSGAETMNGILLKGSPYASATGQLVDCGTGAPEEIPASVAGRIALVHRSGRPFREMARNVREAGALALVIENYLTDTTPSAWTLPPVNPDPAWDNYPFPLSVGLKFADSQRLLQTGGTITVTNRSAEYGTMSGTSMASPHVTGTVALMLSVKPDLPVAQIDYVLRNTAVDIYTKGWDYESAYGIVDALAAMHYIAPERFGVPPPQPIPSPRRRSVR
jgi:subtilisin family serine protease